jgi:peptidoglycan/xylan/chitin deacetylase (PgdA/CDA1 family)
MVATLDLWRRLPGLERVDHGVALTFDDGPDPDGTPPILDALDALGAHATFFMVGQNVAAHPELAREVGERGHEIQLHCFEHVAHQTLSDPADDIRRARAAIQDATGANPALQRPPYGRFTVESHAACIAAGLEPVYWSAWGLDWEQIPADRIADLVVGDVEDGAIVVLHDSPRYGHRPSAVPTAEALPLIARAAEERGLALGGISASRT